jgi:hypothetical protein
MYNYYAKNLKKGFAFFDDQNNLMVIDFINNINVACHNVKDYYNRNYNYTYLIHSLVTKKFKIA